MVGNPTQFSTGWRAERLLQKHSSQPFNPDIANAFSRAGLIEAWGRGFERILEACKAEGLPNPELIYEETGLWLNFQFKPTEVKATVETREKTRKKTREKILWLLEVQPTISTQELAEVLGITRKGVEWQIRKGISGV